jgi:hypothetical protein
MSLVENLLKTDPNDPQPRRKAIEMVVDLYNHGYMAYPHDEGQNEVDGIIDESFRLRMRELSSSDEKETNVSVTFLCFDGRNIMWCRSVSKDLLKLMSEITEIKLDESRFENLPKPKFNHTYEVAFDLNNKTVDFMGPIYDENDPWYQSRWQGFDYGC